MKADRDRPGRAAAVIRRRLVAGRAWLVTGPLGRALAFAVDFSAAVRAARRDRSG